MENTEKKTFHLLPCPSEECLYITSVNDLPEIISGNARLVVDMTRREDEAFLLDLQDVLGNRLLVPDIWQNVLQIAGILISSSLSGGTLDTRLAEAVRTAPGRCWLRLDPLRMRFPLPCPSGTGTPLPQDMADILIDKQITFYSPELCCRYCYDLPKGIILYDTEDTRSEKLRLAEKHGMNGAVMLPWTSHKFPSAQNFL